MSTPYVAYRTVIIRANRLLRPRMSFQGRSCGIVKHVTSRHGPGSALRAVPAKVVPTTYTLRPCYDDDNDFQICLRYHQFWRQTRIITSFTSFTSVYPYRSSPTTSVSWAYVHKRSIILLWGSYHQLLSCSQDHQSPLRYQYKPQIMVSPARKRMQKRQ